MCVCALCFFSSFALSLLVYFIWSSHFDSDATSTCICRMWTAIWCFFALALSLFFSWYVNVFDLWKKFIRKSVISFLFFSSRWSTLCEHCSSLLFMHKQTYVNGVFFLERKTKTHYFFVFLFFSIRLVLLERWEHENEKLHEFTIKINFFPHWYLSIIRWAGPQKHAGSTNKQTFY